MKHLVQYTEEDLERLVRKDLTEKGYMATPSDHKIEFVKTSSGMSALVSGVHKPNVQESDDEEGEGEKEPQKAPRKLPKVTKLSAAAQVLEGDGGVMDRSAGLGEGVAEGVAEGGPRVPYRRRSGRGRSKP